MGPLEFVNPGPPIVNPGLPSYSQVNSFELDPSKLTFKEFPVKSRTFEGSSYLTLTDNSPEIDALIDKTHKPPPTSASSTGNVSIKNTKVKSLNREQS